MKLLHIDSSILGDNSVSRALSADVVAHLENKAETEITYHDLAARPIPHLTGRYLAGKSPDVQHDPALQEDLHLGGKALEEFLAADTVVIGVAMYNFTIPSQLKAWIDRIVVAGKTFHYTENGPVGLAGDKHVILALARGGIYSPGTPGAAIEHQESYLRAIFGFIGITRITSILAEGVALGAEAREKSIAVAREAIAKL
ncbi:FMN-dependent NADH-azoreductase [Brytella acorum]|uniref:FMN dependent NADH:quinone oxidoreductase n=1 Tax=Brytella acorum TaxID=2959299 RepID=A0AA35XX26_9PROT|nr:FMN-dependent NADH-azoreductase [Brytella acorum]MDF3623742.1 FMN-dependent NADH-azoreductase [Brytella acorum]CAI9119840.1 FMN-dependent NADH-azoreductase [Brytella acorum]